jgi:beta-galactosidase
MRSPLWPAPDVATARAGARDGSPWFRRLDGSWRFTLADSPARVPHGFEQPEFDDSSWSRVAVPGCWTMQPPPVVGDTERGFDRPIYTNVQMPFRPQPPKVPDANPTGLYRTTVTVPREWRGRRVVLHFGGAESVLFVWLNGRAVGMSKDSRLAAEFDVTEHVQFGRRNSLCAMVVRWSDASYVEDQDQWWHAGIHREVVLYSTAPTYLADVEAVGGLASDLSTGTLDARIEVGWSPALRPEAGWQVELQIETLGRRRVARVPRMPVPWMAVPYEFEGHVVRAHLDLPDVERWTHETPSLYRAVVTLFDPSGAVREVAACRVGFRRVEVRGSSFLLNGEPITFFGVNRHDFDPDTGRVVTEEQMRADLVLLKQFGFNAVRTSHSPNDPRLLDLCDELGLLVVDEANIESHALNFSLVHDPRYRAQWMARGSRMVERDKNHPCVVMWSLGNESGYGAMHDALAAWIRARDGSRPVHYEGAIMTNWQGGHAATDVLCPMYPEIWAIEMAGGGPAPDPSLAGVIVPSDRPVILCEYSHAMGNSNGCLGEYFDAFEQYGPLQGGFIWEFWDHGLRQHLADGSWRFAYGGDFAELRHDANFCCDGMVWPDRRPKPAMWEHRHLARPVVVTPARGRVRITNRQWFRDLGWLRARVEVAVDGRVVQSAALAVPEVGPQESVTFDLPVDLAARPPGECIVTVRWTTARASAWAPAGHPVGHDQWSVGRPARAAAAARGRRRTRSSVSLDDVLASPPRLALWRAPIDNDGLKLALGPLSPFARWREWGLDTLAPPGVVHQTRTVAGDDGSITFHEHVVIPDHVGDLPRVGMRFDLVPGFEVLEWYGRGPHECYPDRSRGAALGRYRSTVTDEYVPYVMPQEHGLHIDARWLELRRESDGVRVRVNAPAPFMFSALHHTPEQLTEALHDVELVARAETTVHVDHAHRGLGTMSCGPDTLPKYKLGPGTYTWSWRLTVY